MAFQVQVLLPKLRVLLQRNLTTTSHSYRISGPLGPQAVISKAHNLSNNNGRMGHFTRHLRWLILPKQAQLAQRRRHRRSKRLLNSNRNSRHNIMHSHHP
jgi:hypothetical protein